jgi:hypothetical protein
VKFQNVGGEITVGLGTMLGFDKVTTQAIEQQFCVALKARDGWETLGVVENEAIGEALIMLINYDFLPIRWKFCLESFH